MAENTNTPVPEITPITPAQPTQVPPSLPAEPITAAPTVDPALVSGASGGAAVPAAPVAAAGAKKKIMIVEDEQDARTTFTDLLESEGYDVSSAVDGIDALAKAAAEKFDLILLDIVMPNMDGVEVLQKIKTEPAKYGTPVVVMLTNISGDAAVEKAMEIGAAGYKLKIGTEPDVLIKDVKDFLAGKVQNVETEPVSPSFT
jgi:CheY-like chemotaxis protein